MKRRLTVYQKQALLKWGCLLLSVCMVAAVFCSVPHIVKALPKLCGGEQISLTPAVINENKTAPPSFALGSGEYINYEPLNNPITDGEYEPEESIPAPPPQGSDLPVFSNNLSWYELSEVPTLNIINRTDFKIELQNYLSRDFPISAQITEEPLVLIIHTHGSESYLETGKDYYSPEETFRSLDETKTVVHIGEVLCEKLNSLGIPAVHDKTMYDLTDFNKSYNYSREGILDALEKYPTIKFVIDLHRDSVFDSNGNNIKPLSTLNGKDCAQLMLVVGTNQGGSDHPNWRDNLTFATHLQQKINDLYPTLARPVNLRSAAFNQALAKGSVLLEVGSCGNTIEEAENAVNMFAQAYASLLKEKLN